MADFDLLKVKVWDRFFSYIERAPPLTKRRCLRYCASKSVQPRVPKSVKSYEKKNTKPYMLGICTSVPENFFRNQILLDYLGR